MDNSINDKVPTENEDLFSVSLIYHKKLHLSEKVGDSELKTHLYSLLATPVSLPLKAVPPISDVDNALYDAENLAIAGTKFPAR